MHSYESYTWFRPRYEEEYDSEGDQDIGVRRPEKGKNRKLIYVAKLEKFDNVIDEQFEQVC